MIQMLFTGNATSAAVTGKMLSRLARFPLKLMFDEFCDKNGMKFNLLLFDVVQIDLFFFRRYSVASQMRAETSANQR